MEKFFHLKENNTTVKTEVLAGITTFVAMCYILFVNAGMFADLGTVSYTAMYIATALGAIVGTVLTGLIANLPLAQASGMGLNAFAVYTICMGMGFTYSNAMVMVLFDGLIFIALTLSGLRSKILSAIPKVVRMAIPAGIGLFIAYIGLQNSGIIVADASTASTMRSLNFFSGAATWADTMPLLVTFVTIIVIAVLAARKKKGAVLYGILAGTILYYVLGATIPGFYVGMFSGLILNPIECFKAWGNESFLQVCKNGFDFSAYINAHGNANCVISVITSMLAFCLVDMFDTLGTLYGACARGGMVDENGEVKNVEGAMLADAIATAAGAICGTSTVTTFVESAAGIAEGGKTGLTALTTAGLFFVAMFFAPIASLIPGAATAAALIYVGVLMLAGVKDIDWIDVEIGVPAFLTIAVMAFSYSISNGIGFGVISYLLIKLFNKKNEDTNVGMWIVGALFMIMFLVSH